MKYSSLSKGFVTLRAKYIQKKGNTFYFRKYISPKYREYFGNRSQIFESLKTSDELTALRRAKLRIAEIDKRIASISEGGDLRDSAAAVLAQSDLLLTCSNRFTHPVKR